VLVQMLLLPVVVAVFPQAMTKAQWLSLDSAPLQVHCGKCCGGQAP